MIENAHAHFIVQRTRQLDGSYPSLRSAPMAALLCARTIMALRAHRVIRRRANYLSLHPFYTLGQSVWRNSVAQRPRPQSHRQFDVVGERDRQIATGCRSDAGNVFRTSIRVVGDNERTGVQSILKQSEDL
jgi:hypothetical protein